MTINPALQTFPEVHPTLGVPSKIYSYCDIDGNLYAAVYRFDYANSKTIRPYDVRRGCWEFPESPSPYNIEHCRDMSAYVDPRLSGSSRMSSFGHSGISRDSSREVPEFPENPVIIVEGEKCADILGRFGFSGITSMGGSNAAHKTNWSALKGHDVIIWPDNDEAGLKYADHLKIILLKIGVNSLKIASLKTKTFLKACSLRNIGNPATSIDNLPKGWDIADAVKEGWTLDHIEVFLKEAIPIENLKEDYSIESPANDNSSTHWPTPDLSILDTDTPPPKFPIDIFSPQIADWLLKTAEGRSAPVDYVAGTLLTATASLIGNTRKVSPWESWSEPCILWMALVGSPSSGKSPAMDPVLDHIKKIEADEVPAFEEAQREYETDKLEASLARENWQKDVKTAQAEGGGAPIMPKSALEPTPPMRPRLIIRDATSEALCLAMQSQPKGLLMHRGLVLKKWTLPSRLID